MDQQFNNSFQNTPNNNGQFQGGAPMGPAPVIPRSIPLAIILTIVTCGIYGIYWFIKLTDEINLMSGHYTDTSGALSFVLALITCGIYGWFWAYKLGEKCDEINGNPYGNTNILYLILAIFGLSIVVYALAQDTLNKHCL